MNNGHRRANNAIRRVKDLIGKDPAYRIFEKIEAKQVLDNFITKTDIDDHDLSLAGRALHLRTVRLWLFSELQSLRAKGAYYFSGEDDEKYLKALLKGLSENPEKAELTNIEEPEEIDIQAKEEDIFDIGFNADKDLYGTILGLFDSVKAFQGIEDYYVSLKLDPPIDIGLVERCIFESQKKTVKTVAGDGGFFPDQRRSIAITFQACLQLENNGRVVLEQLDNDVGIIKPGHHPSTSSGETKSQFM